MNSERESGTGDPFADFLEAFYSDPEKPLKFLRNVLDGEAVYNPAVDVVEERDRVTLLIDLPGVPKEQIAVEFVAGGVVLRGRRAPAPEPHGSRLRRAERPAGEFVKSVPLPKGLDAERATLALENGVMTLTIPRAEGARRPSLKAGSNER